MTELTRVLIEQRVRAALEKWVSEPDKMVQWVVTQDPDLSEDAIRACLQGARILVDLNADADGSAVSATGSKTGSPMSDTELRVATWLQQRAFERWMRGRASSEESYRVGDRRRGDSRRGGQEQCLRRRDRRRKVTKVGADRRIRDERRFADRRLRTERRALADRRLAATAG